MEQIAMDRKELSHLIGKHMKRKGYGLSIDGMIFLVNKNYTIAYAVEHGKGKAVGISKRNPKDAPDPLIGMRIAAWRALDDVKRKETKMFSVQL